MRKTLQAKRLDFPKSQRNFTVLSEVIFYTLPGFLLFGKDKGYKFVKELDNIITLTYVLYCLTRYNYRPRRSWGKVMFLQASVILLTGGVCSGGGAWSRGGAWSQGVWSRGCLVWSGGVPGLGGLVPGVLVRGGCLVETPRDSHCYWNTFLFISVIDGTNTVAVPGGTRTPHPLRSNFFHFHAVFSKNLPNNSFSSPA